MSSLQKMPLTSSTLRNQFADIVIVFLIGHQLLNGEMHTVAPVMLRIGGYVDTLGIGISQSQFLVDGQPVLDGQDAEHRR